jgi:hypothetical protein
MEHTNFIFWWAWSYSCWGIREDIIVNKQLNNTEYERKRYLKT